MTLGEFRKATANKPDDMKMMLCVEPIYEGDAIAEDEKEYEIIGVADHYQDGMYDFLILDGQKI